MVQKGTGLMGLVVSHDANFGGINALFGISS